MPRSHFGSVMAVCVSGVFPALPDNHMRPFVEHIDLDQRCPAQLLLLLLPRGPPGFSPEFNF